MKRRWLATAAIAFVIALVAAGCSSSDDDKKSSSNEESLPVPTFAAGTTMDNLQKAGKIKIGVKYDQPGFGQKNPTNNTIEGFDIEISKLIAQGIFGGTLADQTNKIEFVESVSKNREPFIQQGNVDLVVATYTINDARKQVVDFAGPYYVAHGDIMVKSDTSNIRSVTDLNGKNVCIVRNSTYEQSVKQQAPQATTLPLDTYSQCADALRDGRVEAVATDNVILAGLVQTSQGAFKLVGTSFTDEPYGIGMKKGDDAFRTFVNDRLQAIEDGGQWKTAFEGTLGKLDLPVPQPPAIDRYGLAAGTTAAPTTAAPTTAAP